MMSHRLTPFWIFQSFRFISSISHQFIRLLTLWALINPHPSQHLLAIYLAFTVGISFIVSPIGGILSDRFNRLYVIIFLESIRIVTIIFAIIFYSQGLNIYYLVLVSVVESILHAARKASIVPLSLTLRSSSQTETTWQHLSWISTASDFVGNIVSGCLVSIQSVSIIAVFFSLLFGVKFFLLFSLKSILPKVSTVQLTNSKWSLYSAIKETLSIISPSKIRNLLILTSMINLCFSPISILLPILIKQLSEAHAWYISFIIASLSVGNIFSIVITTYLRKPTHRLWFSLSAAIIGLSCFVHSTTLIQLMVSSLILGLGSTILSSIVNKQLYSSVSSDHLGRLRSSETMASQIITPIGLGAISISITRFGIKSTSEIYLLCFVITIFMCVYLLNKRFQYE